MKAFHFRLESVMKVRSFELERARQHWLELEGERARRAARLEHLNEKLAEGRALLDAEIAKGAEAEWLALRSDALAAARFELMRTRLELEELMPRWEQAREAMRVARTRLKSLERMRETAVERHRGEALRLEQAELDELAGSRRAHASGRIEEWVE